RPAATLRILAGQDARVLPPLRQPAVQRTRQHARRAAHPRRLPGRRRAGQPGGAYLYRGCLQLVADQRRPATPSRQRARTPDGAITMPARLPVLKMALPYIASVASTTIPAFTQRGGNDKSVELINQQISELQQAAAGNAESV